MVYQARRHPVRRPELSLPIVFLPDEKVGLSITYLALSNLVKGSLALGAEELFCRGGVESIEDGSILVIASHIHPRLPWLCVSCWRQDDQKGDLGVGEPGLVRLLMLASCRGEQVIAQDFLFSGGLSIALLPR